MEFFSGIGSQAKALKNLGIQVNTVGTSEWDVHAIAAYDLIHNNPEISADILGMEKAEILKELKGYTFSNTGKAPLDFKSLSTYSKEALQRILQSVRRNKNFVDISTINGKSLPNNIDILTYSFPCQDLSNVGAFHGYKKGIDIGSGSRSSLLWQVGRILTEMSQEDINLPRYLLMENVPTLLSDRHKKNFQTWISNLEKLGYISQYYQLNSSAFGLPQNRPRLLMISVFVGNNNLRKEIVESYFWDNKSEQVIEDYKRSDYFHQYRVQDFLRTDYTNKKILAEAIECTPADTVSRRKIWAENPKIILPDNSFNAEVEVVRTITTKQDRNPNSGNLYFDSGIEGKSKFRYLTPRECLLFMGFTDEDFKQLKFNNIAFHKGDFLFARDKVIKLAGNSIPVKLLEGVFLQILQIDEILSYFKEQDLMLLFDDTTRLASSKLIRSYLFSNGIRQRLGNHITPQGSFLTYPRYRTTVFLLNDFYYGKLVPNTNRNPHAQRFLKKYQKKNKNLLNNNLTDASKQGWQVLAVWESDLKHNKENVLDWLKENIKSQDNNSCGTIKFF